MAFDNIAAKVAKLLALAAEGSGATTAEASVAATQAQRLVAKYQLDLATIVAETKAKGEAATPVEPIGAEIFHPGQRCAKWEATLSLILAEAFSCRTYNGVGRGLFVVGRPTVRSAFIATFKYLSDAIRRLSNIARPNHVHPREWNNSFGTGATYTINEKVRTERAQIEAANPGMAIVLADEASQVKAYTDAMNLRKGTGGKVRYNGGIEAGRNAANALNLGSVPGRTQNNALRLTA